MRNKVVQRSHSLKRAAVLSHFDEVARQLGLNPQPLLRKVGLTREMLGAEGLYRNLSQRYEEAKLAEASALPDVRVLDPAVTFVDPSVIR